MEPSPMPSSFTRRFHRLLVANRGEIACRILRCANARGLTTVAIYSAADEGALHTSLADQAIAVGPARAADSYLDIERVLDAARRTGCDAVHPGYGFLSENAEFARAAVDAGLVFVGPAPHTIAKLADKAAAKAIVAGAGVPVLGGHTGAQDLESLREAAKSVGYPVLIKATAGGGGRGMRVVTDSDQLGAALESAQREAASAFSDATVLLERYVPAARHVEVQILADDHGSVVSVGERDCSVQRRHQKVVEEAPAPSVDDDLRRRLGEAAIAAARSVDYLGAGTVEFLVEPGGRFHFLEINTRIQVEHPVTEMVTGLDLVDLQLGIAAGEPLPESLDSTPTKGHAIEVRLYAEEPCSGFTPQTGTILRWCPPGGPNVRCDHGIAEGQVVSPEYDPLLAKIIAWGTDRDAAIRRLSAAMRSTRLLGLIHNLDFLEAVVASPEFADCDITTTFLESEPARPLREAGREPTQDHWSVAAAAIAEEMLDTTGRRWSATWRGWRNSHRGHTHLTLRQGSNERGFMLRCTGLEWLVQRAPVDDSLAPARVRFGRDHTVAVNDHTRSFGRARDHDGRTWVELEGRSYAFEFAEVAEDDAGSRSDGRVRAPSSGTVVGVLVKPGERVEPGSVLVSIEAMKIESSIISDVTGTVRAVHVRHSDRVRRGDALVEIDADESADEETT